MKKLTIVTLLFLISITLTACVENGEGDIPSNDIDIEEILNSLTIGPTITENFDLPLEIQGVELEYTSSNERVISIQGDEAIVNRGDYDQNVVIAVEGTYDGDTSSEDFNVVVLACDEVDPTLDVLNNIVLSEEVSENFELPISNAEVTITWESSSSSIVIDNDIAIVTQGSLDTNVILTATAKYSKFESIKTFTIKVLKDNDDEVIDPLEGVLDSLVLPTTVTTNFDLTTEINGYTIEYTTNNNAIIVEGNKAIVTKTTSDINVSIIATVSYLEFSDIKSFNVTVLKAENKIPSIFETLNLPKVVSEDFTLETLIKGVTLEYSSNSDYLTINGGEVKVIQHYLSINTNIMVEAYDAYYSNSMVFNITIQNRTAIIDDFINDNKDAHIDLIDIVSDNLLDETNYLKHSVGESKGKFISEISQTINNKVYKYTNEVFSISESEKKNNLFADPTVYHNAYYKDDDITYIHSEKTKITDEQLPSSLKQSDYAKEFGILADSKHFTNFIIDKDTILESSYLGEENGLYSFKYKLNNETSSEAQRIQMIKYGGLDSVEYTSIEITIFIDSNLNIETFDNTELYKTKAYNINVSMTQTLTTTFTRYADASMMPSIPQKYIDALN